MHYQSRSRSKRHEQGKRSPTVTCHDVCNNAGGSLMHETAAAADMLPLLLELLPCNLHHHDIIAAPYCIKSSHQFGGFVMVKCPWVTSSYKRKKTVILRLLHNLRCSLARQSASHSDFAFSRQPPTQHGMDHTMMSFSTVVTL